MRARILAVPILLLAAVAASAQEPAAPKATWPRAIEVAQGTLTVYQPQLEQLQGIVLTGRSAVSWQPKSQEAPLFGVFWFDARVLIDKDTRSMKVEQVSVTQVRFPNTSEEQQRSVAGLIEAEVPKWDVHASLDDVQASIAVTQRELQSEKGLKATPPKLVFANEPAVLLLYDGEPALRPLDPLQKDGLQRVVNTSFFVAKDPGTGKLYLGGAEQWYEAADPKGPWAPVAAPSPAVKAVWDKNPPPPPQAPTAQEGGKAPPVPPKPPKPPKIVVATQPTELIVFDGKPSYAPVGKGGDLLYADNADGKVLVHVPTSKTYVLVSGRWYEAASLSGPWTPIRPDKLPEAFKNIPPDSPIADVRPFVAGTAEAKNAVADAQIPQTTAVKRDQTIQVTYDGEPQFKEIEGTKLAYAVNTSSSVLRDSGKYYACHQGVWYVADAPKGPWKVSDKRPPSIDQVPASAPVYNTKYVYVYESTPEVVYVGYLPGYVGAYPYYGTVVYGTGWYYPPYIGPVVCYPRPATWGVHMSYNPWTGWGVGISYGTPYFSVGIHFGGHPGYWGPVGYRPPYPPYYGYRPPPPGYRPPPPPPGGGYRPPPPGGTHPPAQPGQPPGARPPGQPGQPGGGPRPSQQPAHNIYNRPENAGRNAQPSVANRQQPTVGGGPNNVYADRGGNVYRQNQGGGWDRNTGGNGWQNTGASPSTRNGSAPSNLNRDAAARSYGGGGRGGGRGGRR